MGPEPRQSLLAIARESKDPSRLRDEILAMIASGATKEFVLGELSAAREQFKLPDEDAADDAVLDAMDLVVGWCGPHARIPFDDAG